MTKEKRHNIRNKLATFMLASTMLFGLSAKNAHAQTNKKKDKFINRVVNVITPESVSVTFGCHHWGGNTYKTQGDFLGDYTGLYGLDYTKEEIVSGSLRWGGYGYTPNPTTTTNRDILMEYYENGNFNDLHITSGPVAGNSYEQYFSIYEIDKHEYNEDQNYTIALGYTLKECGNTAIIGNIFAFKNSYYDLSIGTCGEIKQKNIFKTHGLNAGVNIGLVSGYSKNQVGKFSYIGGGLSLMGGASIGYDFNNGMGFKVMANPAYVTGMVTFNIGNKSKIKPNELSLDRDFLSFRHNNKIKKERQKNLADNKPTL